MLPDCAVPVSSDEMTAQHIGAVPWAEASCLVLSGCAVGQVDDPPPAGHPTFRGGLLLQMDRHPRRATAAAAAACYPNHLAYSWRHCWHCPWVPMTKSGQNFSCPSLETLALTATTQTPSSAKADALTQAVATPKGVAIATWVFMAETIQKSCILKHRQIKLYSIKETNDN